MLLLYHEKLQIMAFIYSNTTSYHTFVFWFLNTVLLTVFVHSNQWHTCSFCKFDGTYIKRKKECSYYSLLFFTSTLGLKHFHFYLFWSSFPQNLIHFNWFLEFYSFCSTIHLKINFYFFSLIEYYFFMKLGACMSTLYTYLKFMLYKSYLSHAMLSRILTPIPKSFFSLQYYGSTKGLRD
jgi:hypothetical protein